MTSKKPDHQPPATRPDHTNIQIDRVHYQVDRSSMTGQELRNLVSPPIPAERDLFRVVPSDEDEKIEAGAIVSLRDGMRFFTAPGRINPGLTEARHAACR